MVSRSLSVRRRVILAAIAATIPGCSTVQRMATNRDGRPIEPVATPAQPTDAQPEPGFAEYAATLSEVRAFATSRIPDVRGVIGGLSRFDTPDAPTRDDVRSLLTDDVIETFVSRTNEAATGALGLRVARMCADGSQRDADVSRSLSADAAWCLTIYLGRLRLGAQSGSWDASDYAGAALLFRMALLDPDLDTYILVALPIFNAFVRNLGDELAEGRLSAAQCESALTALGQARFEWDPLRLMRHKHEDDLKEIRKRVPQTAEEQRTQAIAIAQVRAYHKELVDLLRLPPTQRSSRIERVTGRLGPEANEWAENVRLTWFVFERFDELRSRVAALKIGLALATFESRHGRWPDRLDELSPEIIAEVSPDPITGGSFVYTAAQAAEHPAELPLLYSVGNDGIDDGAHYDPGQPGRAFRYDVGGRGFDAVMPIGRVRDRGGE